MHSLILRCGYDTVTVPLLSALLLGYNLYLKIVDLCIFLNCALIVVVATIALPSKASCQRCCLATRGVREAFLRPLTTCKQLSDGVGIVEEPA